MIAASREDMSGEIVRLGQPGTHDAEGATRPETLRQNNGTVSRTLESDPAHAPGSTEGVRHGVSCARSLRSQDRGATGDGLSPPIFLG